MQLPTLPGNLFSNLWAWAGVSLIGWTAITFMNSKDVATQQLQDASLGLANCKACTFGLDLHCRRLAPAHAKMAGALRPTFESSEVTADKVARSKIVKELDRIEVGLQSFAIERNLTHPQLSDEAILLVPQVQSTKSGLVKAWAAADSCEWWKTNGQTIALIGLLAILVGTVRNTPQLPNPSTKAVHVNRIAAINPN